jgi:DHA1 family inner membrane transport protein
MLAVLCSTTFLVASAGTAIAPFLLQMTHDLSAELAAVANLVSVMSVAWGLTSLAAGTASDRVGRRLILTGGVLTLGGARVGLALAETYSSAVTWQLVTGIGGGAFMGTVFAAVSDRVAPAQRGRALGWVITGQSLSLVFGVPLLTLVGAVGGWRGAIATQGVVTLGATLAVWAVVPRTPRRPAAAPSSVALIPLLRPRVLALLGAGTMERSCFAAMAVYLATYLLTSYGVSLAELAVALALVAAGNLAGNLLGGQVADRLPARPLSFAASSVVTGVLALPLLLWQPGVAISIALGFAYSLTNALGRPSLMAALSEVSSEARGALLGLNITTGSVGWLGATALGGWLVTRFGFGALGVFCAASGLVGGGLAAASWWAAPAGAPRTN